MSANFRDIPANFRDIPANFRDICVLFFVSTRNMLQTCFQLLWEFSSGISPNFLGLPFSYLQPRLPFSYYVMERAAKACEEPENTWNDQKLRYFKFSSLSHPGSSKSRFCWISLFFLALRAPQYCILSSGLRWMCLCSNRKHVKTSGKNCVGLTSAIGLPSAKAIKSTVTTLGWNKESLEVGKER